MKRELKFRLWNNAGDKSKFFYDTEQVMECLKQQILFNDKAHKYHKLGYDHVGGGSSFMQYTGLKDVKGKEIYEGDICEITLRKKYGHQFDNKKAIVGVVEFGKIFVKNNALYEYEAFHINGGSISYLQELEIVGNIYENPELLGKEK